MLSRRQGLGLALGVGVGLLHPRAFAQSFVDDPLPPLPEDLEKYSAQEDYFSTTLDYGKLGSAVPSPREIAVAGAIMWQAPYKTRPIEVARYYRDVGKGRIRLDKEKLREMPEVIQQELKDEDVAEIDIRGYARGWPEKYNPIVIELFKVCGLNPLAPDGQGDATPWCAAFVNYCIARAASQDGAIGKEEIGFGTKSASSGSFRCWPRGTDPVASPVEGDVLCWALEGTVHGCAIGKGHVGFYVGPSGDSKKPYIVLGGNQSGDPLEGVEARKDGVIQKAMPVRYATGAGEKVLQPFRRAPSLKST